jgi:hypothetical protein
MNEITVSILDNGTTRIETNRFSGPVHAAAEAALLWIARELGGETTRTRRVMIGQAIHAHDHAGHEHEHGEHTHTHG